MHQVLPVRLSGVTPLLLFAVVLSLPPRVGAQDVPIPTGELLRIAGGEGTYFMMPRWSPSGLEIAFAGSAYRGLWASGPDGDAPRALTDEVGAGFGYSWSPDGTAIVTRVSRYEGRQRFNAVRVMDTKSGDSRLLTAFMTDAIGIPTWLNNAAQVAVYLDHQPELLDVEGRVRKNADTAGPVLLSDGPRIIRFGPPGVAESTTVSTEQGFVLNPAPSPDGSKVAYEVLGGNLFVADVDGSSRIDLGPGNRPQWSPSGLWIVFQRSTDDGHVFTGSDLYLTSVDGAITAPLTETKDALEMNPSWSPDGRFVAFDDRGAIFLLPVSGD